MTTRGLLFLALLLASAGVRADLCAARPNILFIYADDESFKTVGCYPESWPWVKTPNIDKLAKTGIRFRAAYLGSWCMPSRAALLTGHHPHAIESMTMQGAYPGSKYDPRQCPFWPSVFRREGYQTVQIGKWHTGVDSGYGRDWDYQAVWNRPLHPENAGAYYETEIMQINGVEQKVEGYPADNYTRWAVEFIKGEHRDPNKPWYLWLCYGNIHGPSKPAARHKGMYKDAEVPIPADIFPPRPGKPDYLNKTQAWAKDAEGNIVAGKSGEAFGDESGKKKLRFEDWVRQVNECMPSVDEGVGQLIAALKETGQYDNTLVVYTADQGFSMGEHGSRSKLAPYDANYRSPFIVSMPSTLPQDKVCAQSVNAPDVVTTFFSFASIALPWKMHGKDLMPLLKDPGAAWPHPCFYEHTGQQYGSEVTEAVKARSKDMVHSNVPWYAAVISGDYKYIRYLGPKMPEELYNLKTDPEELTNLAGDAAQAENLERMRGLWMEQLKQADGVFADDLPPPAKAK